MLFSTFAANNNGTPVATGSKLTLSTSGLLTPTTYGEEIITNYVNSDGEVIPIVAAEILQETLGMLYYFKLFVKVVFTIFLCYYLLFIIFFLIKVCLFCFSIYLLRDILHKIVKNRQDKIEWNQATVDVWYLEYIGTRDVSTLTNCHLTQLELFETVAVKTQSGSSNDFAPHLTSKCKLNEYAQEFQIPYPIYVSVAVGPPHNPTFTSSCVFSNQQGFGHGKTKKESEEAAAAYVLFLLKKPIFRLESRLNCNFEYLENFMDESYTLFDEGDFGEIYVERLFYYDYIPKFISLVFQRYYAKKL